jgi:hypothetical protein
MNESNELQKRLLSLRILVRGLILGLLGVGVVFSVALREPLITAPGTTRALIVALLALAVMEMPAYVVVRRSIIARIRESCEGAADDADLTEQLLQGFAAITIIGCAMAEGAALFGLVVGFATDARAVLAVPAAALALLVAQFPRMGRLRAFISSVTGRTL